MALVTDSDGVTAEEEFVPAIPVSAGALIFDRAGRLLILKPTYKGGWTIPGWRNAASTFAAGGWRAWISVPRGRAGRGASGSSSTAAR
jgi:hypothetical protein